MTHKLGHRMNQPSLRLGHRTESVPHQKLGSRVPLVHKSEKPGKERGAKESDLEKSTH